MILNQKYEKLCTLLKELKSVVVAYSGGVDSTFLLYVSSEVLKEKALGVTGDFKANPVRELNEAKDIAKKYNLNHKVLKINPLTNMKVKNNMLDRCYYCKHEIFSGLIDFAKNNGFLHVIDGTNASDSMDDRPGMKALLELKIISPLRLAGLTKNDIRELSKKMNISTWSNPSSPCLMTRFPFNSEITEEKLKQVENAEDYLKKLGFTDFRVRHYGKLARIEFIKNEMIKALSDDLREKIITALQSLGYEFITIDLQGLRSGSMNVSGD